MNITTNLGQQATFQIQIIKKQLSLNLSLHKLEVPSHLPLTHIIKWFH